MKPYYTVALAIPLCCVALSAVLAEDILPLRPSRQGESADEASRRIEFNRLQLRRAAEIVHPPKELIRRGVSGNRTVHGPFDDRIHGMQAWHEDTSQRIVSLLGDFEVVTARHPREAAELFLKKHHKQLGLSVTLSELTLAIERTSPTSSLITYQHVHWGHPVLNSYVHVNVQGTNHVTTVAVNLKLISPVTNLTPRIQADSAIQTAMRLLNADSVVDPRPSGTLYYDVTDGLLKPIWRIRFDSPFIPWNAYVDATLNQAVFFEPTFQE